MGPPESPTGHSENQERRPGRSPRRQRARLCLLKGCEECFHPRQARQRYCSEGCREAARKWSRWKAQQRYRATTAGKQKRNGQSRCYRERRRSRKPPEPEAVNDPARVITTEYFFRPFLRPPRLLRGIRSRDEVLYSTSARLRAGALWSASENGNGAGNRHGFSPEILIRRLASRTFSLSDATGVSPARSALGAPASAPPGAAAATTGVAGRSGPANAYRGSRGRGPGGPLRSSSTAISGSWRWSNWAGTQWKSWCGR